MKLETEVGSLGELIKKGFKRRTHGDRENFWVKTEDGISMVYEDIGHGKFTRIYYGKSKYLPREIR